MNKSILGVIAIIAMVVLVSGCSDTETTNSSGSSSESTSSSGTNLVLLSHQMVTDEFDTYSVKGSVQNNGVSALDYVEVNVKFYDSSGAVIGEGLDNTQNLGPGQVWKFDAMYFGTETPVKYDIEVSDSPF